MIESACRRGRVAETPPCLFRLRRDDTEELLSVNNAGKITSRRGSGKNCIRGMNLKENRREQV